MRNWKPSEMDDERGIERLKPCQRCRGLIVEGKQMRNERGNMVEVCSSCETAINRLLKVIAG